jgi:hypothetical protein
MSSIDPKEDKGERIRVLTVAYDSRTSELRRLKYEEDKKHYNFYLLTVSIRNKKGEKLFLFYNSIGKTSHDAEILVDIANKKYNKDWSKLGKDFEELLEILQNLMKISHY